MELASLLATVAAMYGTVHLLQHILPTKKPKSKYAKLRYYGLRLSLVTLIGAQLVSIYWPGEISNILGSMSIASGTLLLSKNTLGIA